MSLATRVLAALESGPMSAVELAEELGVDRYRVHVAVASLREAGVRKRRQLKISGWVYDGVGARRYPRPLFALDRTQKDASKPDEMTMTSTGRTVATEALRRSHKSVRVSSVFDLGSAWK